MTGNSTADASILLVDDRKENLMVLQALLDAPGLNVVPATSGNEALGLMLDHDFAVVILDVQMPDMNGFEVADLMRRNERTKYIPIIFITAFSKEEGYISRGYETGAVDYLFKPLDPVVLKSKINTFLELHRHKKELEESKKQIEKQNERLKEISIRDGLTGLYNHRYFREILVREFALARRNHSDISCFMIDLDYFKDVNDTFGHAFGDFVLRGFAELLKGIIRRTDWLARYGGEEFVLLLPNTGLEGARVLAEKFRKKAGENIYSQDNFSRRVTVSIGIASYFSHQPPTPAHLVTFADRALYRAKAGGRNQVRMYKENELSHPAAPMEGCEKNHAGVRERMKKILCNTRDNILFSFEALLQQLDEPAENTEANLKKERIRRMTETLAMMGERLNLSAHLVKTFKRSAALHELFMFFVGEQDASNHDAAEEPGNRDIDDYPFQLEEFTRTFDIFAEERAILRYHHENYDGSGFPENLEGEDVPLGARLFTLVDAYVAMTSGSRYHPLLSPQQVVDELVRQAGRKFDPSLVLQLLETIAAKDLLPVPHHIIRSAQKDIELQNGGAADAKYMISKEKSK
jgi:diguanylate cyclase (GGDEF)-like protein